MSGSNLFTLLRSGAASHYDINAMDLAVDIPRLLDALSPPVRAFADTLVTQDVQKTGYRIQYLPHWRAQPEVLSINRMWADKGLSSNEIADKLDLPSDEVEDLIKGTPRDELAYLRSKLEPQCPGCHQTICIDTPRSNYLGKAWHAQCCRKAMFGPYAA